METLFKATVERQQLLSRAAKVVTALQLDSKALLWEIDARLGSTFNQDVPWPPAQPTLEQSGTAASSLPPAPKDTDHQLMQGAQDRTALLHRAYDTITALQVATSGHQRVLAALPYNHSFQQKKMSSPTASMQVDVDGLLCEIDNGLFGRGPAAASPIPFPQLVSPAADNGGAQAGGPTTESSLGASALSSSASVGRQRVEGQSSAETGAMPVAEKAPQAGQPSSTCEGLTVPQASSRVQSRSNSPGSSRADTAGQYSRGDTAVLHGENAQSNMTNSPPAGQPSALQPTADANQAAPPQPAAVRVGAADMESPAPAKPGATQQQQRQRDQAAVLSPKTQAFVRQAYTAREAETAQFAARPAPVLNTSLKDATAQADRLVCELGCELKRGVAGFARQIVT